MLYPAATNADSPLAHMVIHPLQLALVVLFHPPTAANTALALGQLALCGGGLCGGGLFGGDLCGGVLCGGGGLCGGSCICGSEGIYINMYSAFTLWQMWWLILYICPLL